MLKEVIVVEGKSDTAAIRRALEADTIETGGFTLAASTLRKIEAAYKKRGIIILTDPDGAGNRIRRFLTERFPEAGQAFIPRIDATANGDVGVEQASPKAILAAPGKVRPYEFTPQQECIERDLMTNRLSGASTASERRGRLAARVGIGYGHAKRYLKSIHTYATTRAEFNSDLDECGEVE